MAKQLSLHDWVKLHSSLLEQERKTEVEEAQTKNEGVPLKCLESRGLVVSSLVIDERSTGLYGRPTITFINSRRDTPLPANTISSGDIVGVRQGGGAGRGTQLTTGVVTRISHSSVRIAIDDGADELDGIDDGATLQLHKLTSDVTYRRIKAGLQILEKGDSGPASHLVSVLFGETQPRSPAPSLPPQLTKHPGKLQLFNSKLDASQEAAVMFALQRSDLAVIHGPPGTGKTTTIVEVIRQHVKLKAKVLACAPSNLAVDNIVERLSAVGGDGGLRIVRIGHPARVTPITQRHTLDALIHNSEESEILGDIRKDIREQLTLLTNARDKGRRHRIRSEIKTFRKELRERETRLVRQVLLGADVILSTLTSTSQDGPLRHLPQQHLSLTIIDECSQAIEAACYGSLLRAPKVILAGDHCQLPPTIISSQAASGGLAHSLMERVIGERGDEVVKMLTVQYRMHNTIMDWASRAMYQGRLTAHTSVATHLLCHINGVEKNEDTENALVLVDTTGCGCIELDTEEDQSKGNTGEAIIAAGRVTALIDAGVPETEVAVITPYNLQVELIRGLLRERYPKVEVRSVDGFQGREKEAVVLSLVRSNKQGTVGFLSEDRRLNVAVTRARRHLTLICDSSTVSRHTFIRGLLDHMTQHGVVRSAHEYQDELDTTDVMIPESIVWKSKESEKKGDQRQTNKTKPKDSTDKKNKLSQEERDAKRAEDNLRRRKEYLAIINAFVKGTSQTYKFPPDLNSYERRLIHEICDEFGLEHVSQGEGKERRIVLQKKEEKESMEDGVQRKEEEEGEEENIEDEEEEGCAKRREVEEEIIRFVESNKLIHAFSSRLSAYERVLVHEISEEWGLVHESQGEGKKRQVVVRKPSDDSDLVKQVESSDNASSKGECVDRTGMKNMENKLSNNHRTAGILTETTNRDNCGKETQKTENDKSKSFNATEATDPAGNQNKSQQGAIPKVRSRFIGGRYEEVDTNAPLPSVSHPTQHCQTCGKDVPTMNWSLHSIQCERNRAKSSNGANNADKRDGKEKKSKKKTGKKGGKEKTKDAEEEDFDTLVAKFAKENKQCSHSECRAPTTVIGQLCPFCRRTFCLAHHMAEVHGCGQAARHQARTVISREGVLYPGSGVPSKKPSETRRRHLERRLDKRMEELSGQRKAKKPDSDKDKDKGKGGK